MEPENLVYVVLRCKGETREERSESIWKIFKNQLSAYGHADYLNEALDFETKEEKKKYFIRYRVEVWKVNQN